MTPLLFLNDAEVQRALDLHELEQAVGEALMAVSSGAASVPARVAAQAPSGLLAAMPGFVSDIGLAAKLVSVYPANHANGLPSHQALVAVFDPDNGEPLAVMAGTYLTAIRTAMASVLAARHLAADEHGAVAVLGAGAQASAHLTAAAHALPGRPVSLWARRRAAAVALAERSASRITITPDAEQAVRGARIVFCCTDASEPVLESDWVAPGSHVGSVGFHRELPAALVGRARVVVESRAATLPPPAGAIELQETEPAAITELGAVLAGSARGRQLASEVTVYKATGHASEDVAAAVVVLRRARLLGIGSTVAM